MFFIWLRLKKENLEWCIDKKVKTKIVGLFTEYEIVSAIAAVPIKSVYQYVMLVLLTSIIALSLTWLLIEKSCQKYFLDNYYERTLSIFGTSTGVFLTGLLLFRICDPKLESPVLGDYSIGFSVTALIGPLLIILCIQLSNSYNSLVPIITMGILIILFNILLQFYNFILEKKLP